MKNCYIEGMVYGLPKPRKAGWNTSKLKDRIDMEYVHKFVTGGYNYYKVHIGRNGKGRKPCCKIKYFKTLKEAKLFRDFLLENRYI